MTEDERLDILEQAGELGLYGFHGECGEVAIAINEAIFGGHAELVAALNTPIWKREKRLVGHVGVRPPGFGGDIRIWDAEGVFMGEEGYDEFLSKGMLDPHDPDYRFENEEEAYDAEIMTFTKDEIRTLLPWCGKHDPHEILREAVRRVMR
jgi:hypothetical protein